jgi:peptidoglycan pentaglycine glycine transferase (the first glycine)
VGYLSRGPVVAAGADADEVGALIMDHVEQVGKTLRIRHLTVQPPGRTETTPGFLQGRGYLPTETALAPRATVLIDVTRPPDAILAAMQTKMRRNVRLSGRRSVVVRSGGRADLDVYYGMLVDTAARQGFTPQPRAYFERMWEVLDPPGHLRLTLAEFDGRPLAGQLAVVFGDTVVNKLSVWTGEEGHRHPNEAVHWSAITWAHAAGYRTYDLEGIKLKTARAALDGALAEQDKPSVARFKLRFGGDVVVMPPAQVHVPNRVGRWLFGELYPRVSETRRVKSLVKGLRTRSAGV